MLFRRCSVLCEYVLVLYCKHNAFDVCKINCLLTYLLTYLLMLCCVQRATRSGESRPRGGENVRDRGVYSVVPGSTGDVGPDQENDWPFVTIQTGKSHGDHEFPPGSTQRPVTTSKPRVHNDFTDAVIGDDLLPL